MKRGRKQTTLPNAMRINPVYVLLASLEDELLLGLARRALQSKDDLLGLEHPRKPTQHQPSAT